MTTFYCPNCWKELEGDAGTCPFCRVDIGQFWASMSYEEKLIHALSHPEPETAMRAAWLLGVMKVKDAVPSLIRLIDKTMDVYILLEATRALGKINTPLCRQALTRLTHHPARMIRREARSILQQDTLSKL